MSDSSQCQLYILSESSWGVTPASALTALRFNSESFKYNITKSPSPEIRSDGQITGHAILAASPSGGIQGCLSYGTYDDLMKSAMWSSGWSTPVSITGTIACDATQNALVSSTETMNTNVYAGQWILISDHSTSANNDYALVTAATTTHLILGGGLTIASAAGEACTVSNNGMIRNGTTRTSFTLERYHADLTQYFVYTGQVPNTFTINVPANDRITVDIAFMGKDETLQQTSAGTGAASAANTNEEMTAATHVGNLLEGSTLVDVAAGFYAKTITLAFGKNLRERDGVGSLNNVDIRSGVFNATMVFDSYFLSNTIYDKYVANTDSGSSFKAIDSAGNGYIFTIHSAEITDDSGPNAGGQSSDCMENFTVNAKRHTTYNCMLQIDRFAA